MGMSVQHLFHHVEGSIVNPMNPWYEPLLVQLSLEVLGNDKCHVFCRPFSTAQAQLLSRALGHPWAQRHE